VPDNVLTATSVLSACDAWAVGWISGNGANQNLTERWNGSSWSAVTSPSPGTTDNVLNGVDVLSLSNAWAVGAYSDGGVVRGLILHWDGGAWTKVASPNPSSDTSLSAIDAVSASDIWAVGDYGTIVAAGAAARAYASGRDATGRTASTASHTLVLHWNGTSWKQVASPTPGSGGGLLGVTATSASNAWAVGDFTGTGGANLNVILHWNGTAWTRQASPAPGTARTATPGWWCPPPFCPAFSPSCSPWADRRPATSGRWATTKTTPPQPSARSPSTAADPCPGVRYLVHRTPFRHNCS